MVFQNQVRSEILNACCFFQLEVIMDNHCRSNNENCGGAKTCATTGNASLSLCNVDEKGDNPVNVAPISAEAQKKAEKEAEEKLKQDYSSFDIVKATQYGAYERVVELVDEKGKWTRTPYLLLITV